MARAALLPTRLRRRQLPALQFRAIRSTMNTLDPIVDLPIRLVALDDTFALRKAVLRPWLTPEEAQATWADTPEHFQVGALQDGRVVSTAGFLLEAHPDYASEFGA